MPVTSPTIPAGGNAGQKHGHLISFNHGDQIQLGVTVMPALPSSLRQLVVFSWTGFRTYAVFLMQDRDTQSVHRLYDFNTAQPIRPDQAHRDAGNINSSGRLHLVIDSVQRDTKHFRDSNALAQ